MIFVWGHGNFKIRQYVTLKWSFDPIQPSLGKGQEEVVRRYIVPQLGTTEVLWLNVWSHDIIAEIRPLAIHTQYVLATCSESEFIL